MPPEKVLALFWITCSMFQQSSNKDGTNIKSGLKSCTFKLPVLDRSKANNLTAYEMFSGV
jgi:hypothetical protein